MDKGLLDYINKYKNSYTPEQLQTTLLNSGYERPVVDEAMKLAYSPNREQLKQKNLIKINKLLYKITNTFIIIGLALALIALIFIAANFFTKNSLEGEYIGKFSGDSGLNNSMVQIEKSLIKPGTYNVNKSAAHERFNSTYTLTLSKVEVNEMTMKFFVSIAYQPSKSSLGYVSGGSKEAKLINDDGVEITNLSSIKSYYDEKSNIIYGVYFPNNTKVIDDFVVFSQPTSVAKSDKMSFKFPNFEKIEGIILK